MQKHEITSLKVVLEHSMKLVIEINCLVIVVKISFKSKTTKQVKMNRIHYLVNYFVALK